MPKALSTELSEEHAELKLLCQKNKFGFAVYEAEMFSEELCKKYPQYLFVFGDNLKRVGMGGQAIIRYCRNSVGLVTKISPSMCMRDTPNDIRVVQTSTNIVIWSMKPEGKEPYKAMVIPKNIWGSGRANLPQVAPRIFRLIESFREELIRDTVTDS